MSDPARNCSAPGFCRQPAVPGKRLCAVHQAQAEQRHAAATAAADRARGSSAARGYNSKWDALSKRFRHQEYPRSYGFLVRTGHWTPALAQAYHKLREAGKKHQYITDVFNGPEGPGTRFLQQHPIYTWHPRSVGDSAEVDHIVPVTGPADPLFWVSWNHQALTHAQHSEKTATHDGGFRGAGARPGDSQTQSPSVDIGIV